MLKTRLDLSAAFDPQTDSQSERSLGTVKEILRCCVSQTQRDWDSYLRGQELAWIIHKNGWTKYTSFFLTYVRNSLAISDVLCSDSYNCSSESIQNFISQTKNAVKAAKISITSSIDRQTSQYERNRPDSNCGVGDEVILSTAHIPIKEKEFVN